jgi:hypothetical protein
MTASEVMTAQFATAMLAAIASMTLLISKLGLNLLTWRGAIDAGASALLAFASVAFAVLSQPFWPWSTTHLDAYVLFARAGTLLLVLALALGLIPLLRPRHRL